MAAPLLIVVQGAPGVGKTTLLKRLRSDIAMPMLGKLGIGGVIDMDMTGQLSKKTYEQILQQIQSVT